MSGNLALIDQPELVGAMATPSPGVSISSDIDQVEEASVDNGNSVAEVRSLRETMSSLYQLTKPRIVLMVLITAGVAAFFLAGSSLSMLVLLHLMIGTAAVAGSASVFNQFMERDVDALMTRTMKRPLPSGEVSPLLAFVFGSAIGIGGTAYLALTIGAAPAWVGIATWVGYVLIYTPLKQRTAWNTTVGAVAGALPMLMGFTAAGGSMTDPRGWLLVGVLFLWQYPHFMAIAWMYRGQYGGAGFKMTPVVEPTGKSAGWQAILGAIALPITLIALLLPFNYLPVFGLLAVAVSYGMIRSSIRFYRSPDDVTARMLLRSSLVQLPASMAVLIVARILG